MAQRAAVPLVLAGERSSFCSLLSTSAGAGGQKSHIQVRPDEEPGEQLWCRAVAYIYASRRGDRNHVPRMPTGTRDAAYWRRVRTRWLLLPVPCSSAVQPTLLPLQPPGCLEEFP